MDWATVGASGGTAIGTAGLLRIFVAGWLKKRDDHEKRVEATLSELVTARDLLEQRVDRLERDVDQVRRDDNSGTTKLEKKIDRLGAKVSNLTVALASRGVQVRLTQELDDSEET